MNTVSEFEELYAEHIKRTELKESQFAKEVSISDLDRLCSFQALFDGRYRWLREEATDVDRRILKHRNRLYDEKHDYMIAEFRRCEGMPKEYISGRGTGP